MQVCKFFASFFELQTLFLSVDMSLGLTEDFVSKIEQFQNFLNFQYQTYAIFWFWISVKNDLSVLNLLRGLVHAITQFTFRFRAENLQFFE